MQVSSHRDGVSVALIGATKNPPAKQGFAWGESPSRYSRGRSPLYTLYWSMAGLQVVYVKSALLDVDVVYMPVLMVGAPYWMPLVVSGVATAFVLAPLCRRRRSLPGVCATCGYDLRATPDRCPECGSIHTAA